MAIKINNNTIIDDSRNIVNAGISTLGNVTINSGIITATSGIVTYYGDGQYLDLSSNNTVVGVGTDTSVNTTGIVTSTLIDAFIPIDEKVIHFDTVLDNNQENIFFQKKITILPGVTFSIAVGSSLRYVSI